MQGIIVRAMEDGETGEKLGMSLRNRKNLALVRAGCASVACAAIFFAHAAAGRQKPPGIRNASSLLDPLAQTSPPKPSLPNASGLPKPLAQPPANPAKPAANGQAPGQAAQQHPGAAKAPPAHHSKIHLEPVHASTAWNSADRIIQGAVALLPKIVLAAAVFILFVIVARLIRWGIRRLGEKRGIRQNAATLLSKLVQLGILIVGLMAALSIVAPSFTLSDLIKMLGIGGVAIGFAFKDILQNFLA